MLPTVETGPVPALAAGSFATRVIRKLPPPRDAAEAQGFAGRALAEILRSFRRDRGALWLAGTTGSTLSLAVGRGDGIPTGLEPTPAALRAEAHGEELLPPQAWEALAICQLVELHPLVLPGRLIGLLALGARRGSVTDETETTDVEIVAGYLAGLLGGDLLTRRIKETDFELRYRLWELESLYDIGLSIAGNLDPEALAEELLLRGLALVNARRGSLDLVAAPGAEPFRRDFGGAFLSPELVRHVAEGEPFLFDPADGSAGLLDALPAGSRPTMPVLAVPIRAEGRRIGVLAVGEKESRGGSIGPFEANDLRTMTMLAAQAAIALENARLHREAIEKERIEREIEVAASIQREILPTELPDVAGLEVFGRTRPTRVVGGDYYDWLPLPDGRLAVALADVSGKGIPASLLVSTLSTGLHLVVDEPFDAVAALDRLDRHLLRYSATRKFVTLFLAVLDPARDRIEYVSAGHNPALLLRATGRLEQLGSTGIPLGMLGGKSRRLVELPFFAGDRLLVYSDGITEAASAAGEEFGLPGLEMILAAGQDQSGEQLARRILEAVETFARGVPQYDDQTLLVATRTAR